MAQPHTVYTCSHCDAQYPKWVGRCSQCGKFGTVATSPSVAAPAATALRAAAAPAATVELGSLTQVNIPRTSTGSREFDRVLGGGLAAGSVVLVTGEPGVGKSTFLLALAGQLSPSLYVSGEESAEQVAARLTRIGAAGGGIAFSAETNVAGLAAAARQRSLKLVVVDSLQTMQPPEGGGTQGSPSAVRAVLAELVSLAKELQVPVAIIGHVTKEGSAAGPKAVEHLVDVVLELEGSPHQPLRFLHASKNRFGPTDEVGVFEAGEQGFREVENPSALFLAERHRGAGSCVTAVLEGSRALLVEVQALVTRSQERNPKRATTGFDFNRLQLLLAVLGERAQVKTTWSDVYVNLAGGFRSREPALDLAVAAAVVSASLHRTLPENLVAFGEVGLGGEVRPVPGLERRLGEAARLGFTQALVPVPPSSAKLPPGLALVAVRSLAEAADWVRH